MPAYAVPDFGWYCVTAVIVSSLRTKFNYKNMKLITMTDFVLEQNEILKKYINHDKGALFERCEKYAHFLKQPLNLGMFVPCDEDVNVLEYFGLLPCHELDIYRKAKESVLFDGFAIDFEDGCINPFIENFPIGFFNIDNIWVLSDRFKTIEDLAIQKLTLTKSAIEALGL
jgi:hypothetical protein